MAVRITRGGGKMLLKRKTEKKPVPKKKNLKPMPTEGVAWEHHFPPWFVGTCTACGKNRVRRWYSELCADPLCDGVYTPSVKSSESSSDAKSAVSGDGVAG